MNSVKKFVLVILLLLVTSFGTQAQFSGPNNCELCYSTYFSDQVGLNQCLIDNNCEVDVPIDFGIEFLVISAVLLFVISNRKYKLTN